MITSTWRQSFTKETFMFAHANGPSGEFRLDKKQAEESETALYGLAPQRVNTHTPGLQTDHATAPLADGGYVVAWRSFGVSGDSVLSLQRFGADGERLGAEVVLSVSTSASGAPAIAGLDDGGYVVVIQNVSSTDAQTTFSVSAQHYSADGTLVGSDTLASVSNSYPGPYYVIESPHIAPLDDGAYVVAWLLTAYPQFVRQTVVQQFHSTDQPVGAELLLPGDVRLLPLTGGGYLLNSDIYDSTGAAIGSLQTTLSATEPWDADALAGGGYVVVYPSLQLGPSIQLFDEAGAPVSERQFVAPENGGAVPQVAALEDGGYVVTWLLRTETGNELLLQRFDSEGASAGNVVSIEPPEGYSVSSGGPPPSVTALADGGFAVTWIAVSDQTGPDVFTQKFEEAIVGTADADRLAGTPERDFMHGQAGQDRLEGFAGDDKLDGGEGRDRMIGGPGDDSYIVDHLRDQVVERAGEGQDVVYSSIGWRLDKHVESLILTGSGDIDGIGNEGDNVLTGNAGANRLAGGKGSDVVDGMAGADTIVLDGKPGEGDVLLHFVAAEDVIELGHHVVSALDAGVLDASAFTSGAAAADGATRIIHQPQTGALMYDPDGAGEQAAVQIGTFVQLVGVLSADNFMVV